MIISGGQSLRGRPPDDLNEPFRSYPSSEYIFYIFCGDTLVMFHGAGRLIKREIQER